jgi:valyl-tRNA synthetase
VSRSKLANDGFVSRAKPEVVQAERDRMTETEERIVRLRGLLARIGG